MAQGQDIFDRLKMDHDTHRELFSQLGETGAGSEERGDLLERLTIEVKSHAAAEEQALYSTMLRKPPTTSETRHSVAEHHDVEEMLNDLAATDLTSPEWMPKFEDLRHRYTHHIEEEEEEHFPDFAKYLNDSDLQHMRSVFERRKQEEAKEQEVTPEKMEDAQE